MSLISEDLVEKLIEEVEKRPALYKKSMKEYSDINIKRKLWLEVCEAVVPEWNQLDSKETTKQGNEVQKRWNNLRTCFRRELNAQKNTKSGQAASKRRKYVYFDKMLFLLPCCDNRPTESNLELLSDDDDDGDDTESGPLPSTSIPTSQPKKIRRLKKNRSAIDDKADVDKALLQALEETKPDEDTNFALSIIPSLRALSPEEKLDAKIDILNIFKKIIATRHHQTTTTSYQRTANYLAESQFSTAPNVVNIQSPITSPGCSNDTVQSYYSNFDDSELINL